MVLIVSCKYKIKFHYFQTFYKELYYALNTFFYTKNTFLDEEIKRWYYKKEALPYFHATPLPLS